MPRSTPENWYDNADVNAAGTAADAVIATPDSTAATTNALLAHLVKLNVLLLDRLDCIEFILWCESNGRRGSEAEALALDSGV